MGMHIDNKLTRKEHINYVNSKISEALYTLRVVK